MNKVILTGNLGSEPELKYTQKGRALCTFRMATNEHFMVDGERRQRTEWHNIVVWGERGENCAKYLTKGRQVTVEGALRTTMYEKDGVKHYPTKVEARNVEFLGKSPGKSADAGDEVADGDSLSETEVPI